MPDDTCTSSVVVVVVIEWDRERKPTASKGYYLAVIPVKESYRQFILFTTIDNPTTATSSAADLCSSMRMEIFFSLSLCVISGVFRIYDNNRNKTGFKTVVVLCKLRWSSDKSVSVSHNRGRENE